MRGNKNSCEKEVRQPRQQKAHVEKKHVLDRAESGDDGEKKKKTRRTIIQGRFRESQVNSGWG